MTRRAMSMMTRMTAAEAISNASTIGTASNSAVASEADGNDRNNGIKKDDGRAGDHDPAVE